MAYRSVYTLFGVLFCTILFFSNSSNPPNARTGAPGDDGTCATGCHGGGSYQGGVDISGIPTSIQAGQTYTVTLTTTATSGSPVVGGFQILALNSANQNVGDMIVTNGAETGTNTQGGREYMEHRGAKNYSGNSVSWTFDWQAPNGPNDEDITFWFVSVMANNNGQNNGDNVVMETHTGTIFGAPDPLTISLDSKMDVSCFGGNDGTATVSTNGGTPPITITWSNGQTGPTATGLIAGGYQVQATDANGQTVSISEVIIHQPALLTLAITSETPITCVGPATITVGADGGTPGYDYLWSTGTPGATEILNDGNTVFVSVTDQNGCTTSIDVTPVVDIDPPIVSASGGTLTCLEPSVVLQVSANSPCGIYTYSWTDPSGNFFSNDSAPVVTEPGVYSVVVTDVCNGCTAMASATVVQDTDLPDIIITGMVDTITCLQPIIEIDLSVFPNVSYLWTTVNGVIAFGANEPTVGVSKGGQYTILLTDTTNGCTSTQDITVTQINAPVGIIDSTAMPLCFGQANGYAGLSATGGLPPVVFTWPDSSHLQIRNDLSAGSYIVTLMDSIGCTDTLIVVISQPTALLANIGSAPESAQGADDGSAWVAPSGGTPGYTVLWSTGGTTDTITMLAPGMYQATVTDANGCTNVKSTTVQAFGCALTGIVSHTDVDCFGDSTGIAVVTWLNEVGAVSIEWSTGDTTAQIENVPAGEYIVLLTDEGNCTFSDTITIGQSSEIVVTIDSIQDASGPGMNDGGIFISVSGGHPPYSFGWFFDKDLMVGMDEDLTGVGAGTYLLVIHDSTDCMITVEDIEIQELSALHQPDWSDEIHVFPVPMQEDLSVQLPRQGVYTLRLMDSRGMIQQTQINRTTQTRLSVQDLPEGAYWLIIQDESGAFTVRKLIK
ncbi:MAG: SprB repeat-containing protein [Saprospiraceae bacterium]|nr:SprB repeat-containing protein [Saprospiraceae bacterium]